MSIPDGTIELDAENYSLLVSIFSHSETQRKYIGSKGTCRFCGETDPKKFKNEAHTFPHFFESDKIFNRDECDNCNINFGRNEGALAERVMPFLTLGGIKGKSGKSPQTGRSLGSATISERPGTPRSISFAIKGQDFGDHVSVDPATGTLKFKMPIPPARYVPLLAYKALAKMGVAILPKEHLKHFENLRAWLAGKDELAPSPRSFEVVTSYANVMNPAPIIQGAILTRLNDDAHFPKYVFVFVAGAMCFQITLETDDEHNSGIVRPSGVIGLKWRTVIGDNLGARKIQIGFHHQKSEDWSSPNLESRALQAINLEVQLSQGSAIPK